MTEAIATLTGTAQFSRKVSDGNYGSAEAGIFVQFEIDPNDTEATTVNARDAFFQAKGAVFDQLDIAYDVREGGYVMELLDRKLGPLTDVTPGATAVSTPSTASSGRGTPPPSYVPPAPPNGDRPQSCANCGGADFYDNRAKKASGDYKPNAPDYKCSAKGCGKGVWLTPYAG